MKQLQVRPSLLPVVSAALALLALAGCGHSRDSQPAAATPAPEAAQAEADKAAQGQEARAAELAAKEKELADREAALKQQEVEQGLARRAAEDEAAAKAKAASTPAKTPVAKAATGAAAGAAAAKAPPPPPKPIVVPAGTQLAIELAAPVTTKTAQVGDPVQGRLKSDLVVDGRRAAAAGAPVSGSVTKVVSGSKKVGGTPKIVLVFDTLTVAGGATVPISAKYVQEGKSDTGKDTAKVVGGAAAGAIIGNQVSTKNGAVIGGLIGGAAGTAAAYGTGGEVSLESGTVISVATATSFEVKAP